MREDEEGGGKEKGGGGEERKEGEVCHEKHTLRGAFCDPGGSDASREAGAALAA